MTYRAPLLALLLALAGAGCSNEAADTNTAGDRANTTTTLDLHEQGVRYSDCMRENGVPDFPDPDASGTFPNYGVSVTPDVFTAAIMACEDVQPESVDYSSERTPEQQSAALKFAQCVRDNGVPDFPDPVDGEPLIDTYKIPSSDTEAGMAILNAATAKCGDLIQDSMGEAQEGGGR